MSVSSKGLVAPMHLPVYVSVSEALFQSNQNLCHLQMRAWEGEGSRLLTLGSKFQGNRGIESWGSPV